MLVADCKHGARAAPPPHPHVHAPSCQDWNTKLGCGYSNAFLTPPFHTRTRKLYGFRSIRVPTVLSTATRRRRTTSSAATAAAAAAGGEIEAMDVLLGSIDVKELLSTQDLDESSPLSAPDLRLVIDRLQIHSLHIKDKVRGYVAAQHQVLADIFSRCSSAASRSDAVADALCSALRILSDCPADLEIRDLVKEMRSKRSELEERRAALALVETVSGLLERLRTARADLVAGRVVEASEGMRDLKLLLRVDESEESGNEEPIVYALLRKEWADGFDELQEVLARHVEGCVRYEVDDGRVVVCREWSARIAGTVQLRCAMEALEIAGVMNYGLAKAADLIIKHVITPAISSRYIDIFVELHHDSLGKPEATLNLVQSSEYQNVRDFSKEHQDGSALYSRLTEVIKFIYSFICLENHKWIQCFGRLTWSRMSDLIINHFLSKVVPDDAANMVPFQDIMKTSAKFESFLKEMTFISTADNSEERLSIFAHNVEVHFASRKRNEILAKARNILLQYDCYFSPENMTKGLLSTTDIAEGYSEHFADLLLQPEKCYISKAVCQLMGLVHETLKDVCVSSANVAKKFYHAAKDILYLYKAIVPIKLAKQLDGIDQAAIVIHNDCYCLFQEVLGLAFEYRADLPCGLKKNVVFVDIAPNFYEMSERILEKQVHLVGSSLREAIDGADGFQNTHQHQQYELAKFSIDQVVFILEKVHIMWEPLMPPWTYRRTMCTLLESVISRITKDMLLLDDIAAEETLQLQRLIYMILENQSSLFESLFADNNEKEQFLKDSIWARLDGMIPSLCKICKLADLFDMPLKSITTAWETGELVHCGFTSSEVGSLIRAIFTDSPLRKECLWRIESANSQD